MMRLIHVDALSDEQKLDLIDELWESLERDDHAERVIDRAAAQATYAAEGKRARFL
jgi:hypothetical protein